MTVGITTTSTLGDTLPTIIEEARFTEAYKEVISKLVWRINKPLHSGLTTNLPYWGTVSAESLTQGVDMANPTAMADTSVPFTPAEVGCQIIVTDKLVRDNQEDVIRAAGVILGNAMVAKRETDLAGQFGDGTTDLGSNGSLTLGMLAAGQALLGGLALTSGGPAPKPYVVIHHPYVLLDIVDIFTPLLATTTATYQGITGMGGLADEMLRNYLAGRILGMNVYESGNITITSATCDGVVLAAGRGGGLVLVMAKEWDVKPEYDASLRATELNIVGEYTVGEYLAGWMVELSCDATTPA